MTRSMHYMAALGLLVGCVALDPASDLAPAAAAAPARAEADRPDDEPGWQVHVVYALPADGVDRRLDLDGTIARSVAAFDGWLAAQTGKQRLRLDRAGGMLDVTFVRLAEPDARYARHGVYIRDALERELKTRGFADPRKLYAVYYDGTAPTCGGGPWPPELPGNVAALYLKGTPPGAPPCDEKGWSPDGAAFTYREQSMLHELIHALGFVPRCAAHHVRGGHTSLAPSDLMYAGDQPWRPSVLDAGREFYDHGRPGCLDLAKSVFLTPTAPDAAPPPSWSRAIAVEPARWAPLPVVER